MRLLLDAEHLCIRAETVNFDTCPHSSRWMYKLVQAGLDKILFRPRRDDSLKKIQPLVGIFKVLLSTIDGKDTVELSNLCGPHNMTKTISRAIVPVAPLKTMWLTDPHDCDSDCCSQPVHRQPPLSTVAATSSRSIAAPPSVSSALAPFSRVRAVPA